VVKAVHKTLVYVREHQKAEIRQSLGLARSSVATAKEATQKCPLPVIFPSRSTDCHGKQKHHARLFATVFWE